MRNRPQRTWFAFGAITLLAAALALGGCGARIGAGETAAQPAAQPAAPATPAAAVAANEEPLALPTPTPTAGDGQAGIALPTPTPAADAPSAAPATAPDAADATPGPAAEAASTQQAGEPPLLLDLPALVISYNPEGMPNIGMPIALGETPAYIPETVLTQLTLDRALLDRLAQAGIQHAMISNTPTGLRILVDGQQLPTLVWDQESLNNLLLLVAPDQAAEAAGLVTTVLNLGVGVVVQIPPWSGADGPIPLIATGGASHAVQAQTRQQEFMQRAGERPVMQIPVNYQEDGSWTVQGISDTQWQALTGLPFGYIRLNPDLLSDAAAAGISQVILWTDPDGIHLTIGDRQLPYLRWADGGFYTLLRLLEILDVTPDFFQANVDAHRLLVEQLLPALQSTDLRIVVQFP